MRLILRIDRVWFQARRGGTPYKQFAFNREWRYASLGPVCLHW